MILYGHKKILVGSFLISLQFTAGFNAVTATELSNAIATDNLSELGTLIQFTPTSVESNSGNNTLRKIEIGVKLNLGSSKLSANLVDPTSGEFSTYWRFSGFTGIYAKKSFDKGALFGEILICNISGLRKERQEGLYPNNQSYRMEKIRSSLTYLTFPIYYSSGIFGMDVYGGAFFSILISQRNTTEHENHDVGAIPPYRNDRFYERIRPVDGGVLIGVSKKLSQRLAVEMRYFHGITNIRTLKETDPDKRQPGFVMYDESTIKSVKTRQLTFGVTYRFGK